MQRFFDAIQAGDSAQVALLLQQDPALANSVNDRGQSALVSAKYHRREAVVGLLVAAGAAVDIFGAAMLGQVERIDELLAQNRSQVSLLSADGWTPLHLAAYFSQPEAARVLLNKGAAVNARSANTAQNTPLHAAAAGGSAELVRLLLDHGANVNARQASGWTALHAAAQQGNIDMARILLEGGADVSARADNQQRPIDLAVTHARQVLAEFLEANGAVL
jgi:ankyrin repeat protein